MANCFGKNYFKIDSIPTIKTSLEVTAPVQKSLKNENPAFSSLILLDFSSLKCAVGSSFNGKSTNAVVDFLVNPIRLDKFQWSIWTGYHLYNYYDVFREHDFLLGSYVLFYPIKNLIFKLDNGSILKTTDFTNNAITNIVFKASYFLGFSIIWDINDMFRLFTQVRSISLFDCPLMGTPFFNLGTEMNFSDRVTLGLDYSIKMIDMIAVAENISEMLLRIYTRIKL